MTVQWVVGAIGIAAASFVMGLAGFGIALVGLALLPFVMAPATAVVLLTLYALVFAVVIAVQLRRDITPGPLATLLAGSVLGTPAGVWILASVSSAVLNRLIGAVLIAVVVLEWRGLFPQRLAGRGWGLAAGVLAGFGGGAVGTPGPPVVVWCTAQGWAPRTMKANLQAFFVVNQGVILTSYWWAGLLTPEVWRVAAAFALPALAGVAVGMALFRRIDPVGFRRVVFGLLFLSGTALLLHG
ncbi:MAG TPA: sulfite exporter TauE/SafE family protein [Methylomirabilota bacterium]|nr:sulfite exporter TauE/SafE family protein [Methylomirabilota bacterium]